MTITYFTVTDDFYQGSEPWRLARCGLLTGSEMHLVANVPKEETRIKKDGTPYKQREYSTADNDKCKAHVWELAAQRLNKYVEPTFIGDEMTRGHEEEEYARMYYAERYGPVEQMGFITNDRWGFTIGCSPDALVGKVGMIEAKSRRQKFQVETICDWRCPEEHWIQVQTNLLVPEREWLDYLSYSNGMPMARIRCYPDERVQAAIVECAGEIERRIQEKIAQYSDRLIVMAEHLTPTQRRETAEWI